MSNGTGHPVNLTRISTKSLAGGHAPIPGSGEAAKKDIAKFRPITEHTEVKRTIPVTDFKPADWEPEAEAEATPPAAEAAEKTRHEKWKAAQEAKRTSRAAASVEAAAKRQGLAKELLAKGDLPGAAKALGLPVSELVTLVNQGAMGIKPEAETPKVLTPDEQRAADDASFKAEMKAFRAEQAEYRNAQAMASFLDKEIRPVLADKDAYEMIHAAGASDIETYAYRYMNQHYYDTSEKDAAGKITKPGEILVAKDVLDAIEANLVTQAEATVERNRGLKKLSKHFAPAAGAVAQDLGADLDKAGSTSLTPTRRARIAAAMAEELAAAGAGPGEEEEESEPEAAVNPVQPKVVRPAQAGANVRAPHLVGGRLTPAQRVAAARAEEEAAARASLFGKARR